MGNDSRGLNGKSQFQPWRRTLVKFLVPVYLALIFGGPTAIIGLAYQAVPSNLAAVFVLGIGPLAYSALFMAIGGILSLPHQKGIVEGKFPRDVAHPVYFDRRMYGLCWTSLYYFKPVYYICLTVPSLKTATFRLFGYRGHMGFTVYPDTWIRDLPLLEFGDGAYISNRATIGTNIAMRNGSILVSKVRVEAGGLVGHLTMLGPGAHVGKDAEIGVGCGIGMQARIADRASVGPVTVIDNGAVIAAGASVGTMSYVGKRTELSAGVSVPAGSMIPNRQVVRSGEDAKRYLSSSRVDSYRDDLDERLGV